MSIQYVKGKRWFVTTWHISHKCGSVANFELTSSIVEIGGNKDSCKAVFIRANSAGLLELSKLTSCLHESFQTLVSESDRK